MLHIVLHQPEIPPNTGNIGRLCASNDLELHLVKPLGFELNDKYLRRAGMDYWRNLKYSLHEDWQALCESLPGKRFWYFSTKGKQSFWQASFRADDVLVFGSETRGLPREMIEANLQTCLQIPMLGQNYRSLNLSTSVGIAAYEALRQVSLQSVSVAKAQ